MKLREGRLDFYAVQAPLMNAVVAAPLAAAGYGVPPGLSPRAWLAGRALLYRSGYDARRMLLLARLPVIALLVALCFAVYLFVLDATQDRIAALVAMALTGFCPNLLAHGHLATVDLGLAFFLFTAAALFLRLLRAPSHAVAIACGLATGCAIASKTSGALIVIFFALTFAFVAARARRLPDRGTVRVVAVAAAVSLATFMTVYLGLARSFDVTLPFREYLHSVAIVRHLYTTGYTLPQFLLGEFSRDGWPHYHLVAFVLKTTLPALVLLLLAVLAAVRRRRFESIALLLFAVLFLAVASFSKLNLGLRHILPIYPFAYAAIGLTIAQVEKRVLAYALLAWHVGAGVAAYPSYLSYFNPLIGSHRNADTVLIDSNLDWGQDLHRLAEWTRTERIPRIRVHYFGGGDVAYELGPNAIPWPAPRGEPLPPGYFAVSRHLYRITFAPGSRMDYDTYLALSRARYVRTIGGSIDVWRVE